MNYLKTLLDLYRLKRQAKFTAKQMRTLQEKKLRKMLRSTLLITGEPLKPRELKRSSWMNSPFPVFRH